MTLEGDSSKLRCAEEIVERNVLLLENVFSYKRMWSLTRECVLLLEKVDTGGRQCEISMCSLTIECVAYYRMCSLTIECVLLILEGDSAKCPCAENLSTEREFMLSY